MSRTRRLGNLTSKAERRTQGTFSRPVPGARSPEVSL